MVCIVVDPLVSSIAIFIIRKDILLGRPSKEETNGQSVRLKTLKSSNIELAYRHGNDTSFPNVQYKCGFSECYGYPGNNMGFSELCSMCMNEHTNKSQQDSIGVVVSDHKCLCICSVLHIYLCIHMLNFPLFSLVHINPTI